jgi:hypothetical protein
MKTLEYIGEIYLRNSRDNLQMNNSYDINEPIVQTVCELHVREQRMRTSKVTKAETSTKNP